MIGGGLGGGGETVNARKKHLRQCMAIAGRPSIKTIADPKTPPKPKIIWDMDEVGDVISDHDDPLVIEAVIANFGVSRLFVDQGSSADILFLSCFEALGFATTHLKPFTGDLHAFNCTTSKPLGMITLRLSLGTPPTSKSADIQFLVLDIPSAYNAILGRGVFSAFSLSISHPHLAMKFVAKDNKVATVLGNQMTARSCYNISLRPSHKVVFREEEEYVQVFSDRPETSKRKKVCSLEAEEEKAKEDSLPVLHGRL